MSPLQRNNRSEKQRSSCMERCTWHVSLLKAEEEYVRRRYRAVVRTVLEDAVLRIPRAQAAPMIGRSRRQLQRIVRRFVQEGIPGLGSRRPHTSPDRTPEHIEKRIVEVRKATGFGSSQIALIVNEGLSQEGSTRRTTDTTCYNILARNHLVEAGQGVRVVRMGPPGPAGPVRPDVLQRLPPAHHGGRPFEEGLGDEAGGGRRRERDEDASSRQVREPAHGSQFSRMNSTMRRYCESSITGRHIWSSVHHPQTSVQLPEGAEEVPEAQAREEQRYEGDRRIHRGLPSLVQSRQDGVHDRMLSGAEVLGREGPGMVQEARSSP